MIFKDETDKKRLNRTNMTTEHLEQENQIDEERPVTENKTDENDRPIR